MSLSSWFSEDGTPVLWYNPFSFFDCNHFCTLITIPLRYKRVPNSSEKIHLQISCHTVMATSLICYCIHTQAQARTNDLDK